nr:DnaB [Madagascaria erythrocladioides]
MNQFETPNELPHNATAEKLVLACLISNPQLLEETISILNAKVFYRKEHENIYDVIEKAYEKLTKIDFLTLMDLLTKTKLIHYLGEEKEIKKLGNQLIDNNCFEDYIHLLLDKFLRRSVIQNSASLVNLVTDQSTSIDKIFYELNNFLDLINKHYKTNKQNSKISYLLEDFISTINDNTIEKNIKSGFKDFDNITTGFHRSDFIIIASRPAMGKTALALNIATNITKATDTSVAFFSLEMPTQQLIYRIISSETQIAIKKLRSGQLNTIEWKKIKTAALNLSSLKLYIDDTPNITFSILKAKVQQLIQSNKDLSLIIVDYLQLISNNNNKNTNRHQELSLITRSLKILAREFNIVVIVLSQLSRNVESRNNKRPILSDLKESGCISQNSLIETKLSKVQINQLPQKKLLTIYSENANKHLVLSSINKVKNNKQKLIYKIVTQSGYSILLTANHKLKSLAGWKKCNELNTIDKIAISIEHNYLSYNKTHFFTKSRKPIVLTKIFEKILLIHLVESNIVYDIEMHSINNFIANNIVIHNSIEQDADLVCMLHNEDYYKLPETKNQEKSLAQISVLKHRNGAVGTFELEFLPQFAQFINKTI